MDSDPRHAGPYELLGRLGSGGMAVVYLARTPGRAQVAVKIVHQSLASDASFLPRFAREVRSTGGVNAVGTARVLDADLNASPPYLVTEYVEGPTLDQRVRSGGPLDPDELHALAAGVIETLVAIHRAGLIHRDLKPGNVLLSRTGPRVVDFGIAAALEDTALTSAGIVVGTPAWLAPEQVLGEKETTATDVFAWGCLVAYAGTGVPPFGQGRPDVYTARLLSQPPTLTGLDGPLCDAVARSLVKDPAGRPTAAALLLELTGQSEARTVAAPPAVADIESRLTAAITAPGVTAKSRAHAERRQPAAALVVGAVALVIAAVAGTAFALGKIGGRPGPAAVDSLPQTRPSASRSPAPASPAAPASPTPAAAPSPADPDPWLLADFVARALPSDGTPPPFPAAVPDFALADTQRTTVRAFIGQDYSTIYRFPDSTNKCAQQRFFIRWRALDPTAIVEVTSGNSRHLKRRTEPVRGNTGWQSSDGCYEPGLRETSSGSGSFTDVTVEYQRWQTAVG